LSVPAAAEVRKPYKKNKYNKMPKAPRRPAFTEEDKKWLLSLVQKLRTNDLGCRIWDQKVLTGSRRSKGRPAIDLAVVGGCVSTPATKDEVNVAAAFAITSGFQQPPDRRLVASHLCHNSECCEPTHIVMEPQGLNDRRSYCGGPGRCACHASNKCLAAGTKYKLFDQYPSRMWNPEKEQFE
jgi:hypothetical protein